MKRIFWLFTICTMLLCMVPLTAQASENTVTVEYFDDGSYLVTTISSIDARILTKVSTKTREYYSADDVIQWKMTVTGEFLYDGTTCNCTYASGTTTIYATSLWGKNSDSASYSGNSGTYTVVFNRKFMGITTNTVTQVLTITCDENGNIS